jgi:hypothetical protein
MLDNHYVRNSNRKHKSEMCPQMIISNLVRRDVPALLRHRPGSGEVKKETLSRHGPGSGEVIKETLNFLTRLSLFKIGDAPAFLTKARHTFC